MSKTLSMRHLFPFKVKNENIRLYKTTQKAYVAAIILHAISIPVFWLISVKELALFNIFLSVPLFFLSLINNRLGRHSIAFVFCLIEIYTHQILAIFCFGWGVGYELWLIYLAGLCFFYSNWKSLIRYSLLLIILITYILLYFFKQEGVYILGSNLEKFSYSFNAMCCIFTLSLLIHYFAKSAKSAEKELRKANNSLNKKNKKLNELNATKDKFFKIIAHDLKTPIGQMIQISDFIEKRYPKIPEDKLLKLLNAIKHSSVHGFKLLENLLEWSRSQTSIIEFKPENLVIHKLFEDNIELLKSSAAQKHIQLLNNVDKNIKVMADKNMINTIIRNLLSNAIKFTSQNGKVELFNRDTPGNTEFMVKDNGIGMTEDESLKLFKIESSSSKEGTNSEVGTGIGLILCKEFIDKHNGKIWVNSEVNKGSTFCFSIPKSFNSNKYA